MSSVEVFQESDGRWRWEYRDDKLGLKSNRTYGDEASARRAARIAYPEHFRRSSTSGQPSGGFIHKIAVILAVVLTFAVWRRRAALS
jgi:hypothetical protein